MPERPPKSSVEITKKSRSEETETAVIPEIPAVVVSAFEKNRDRIRGLFLDLGTSKSERMPQRGYKKEEQFSIVWAVLQRDVGRDATPEMLAQKAESLVERLMEAQELVSKYRGRLSSERERIKNFRAFDAARFGKTVPLSKEMEKLVENSTETFFDIMENFQKALHEYCPYGIPVVEHSVTEAAGRVGDVLERLGIRTLIYPKSAYPTVPHALSGGENQAFPGPFIVSSSRDFSSIRVEEQSREEVLRAVDQLLKQRKDNDASSIAVLLDDVSHFGDVSSPDALKQLIAELHSRGVVVVVDGAQSAGRLKPVDVGADVTLSTTGKAFGGGDSQTGYLGLVFFSQSFAERARRAKALKIPDGGSLEKIGTLPLLSIARATERLQDIQKGSLPLWTSFTGECLKQILERVPGIIMQHPQDLENHVGIFSFITSELEFAVADYMDRHQEQMKKLHDVFIKEGLERATVHRVIANRLVVRRLSRMKIVVALKEAHAEQVIRMDVHQTQFPSDVQFGVEMLATAVSDVSIEEDMENEFAALKIEMSLEEKEESARVKRVSEAHKQSDYVMDTLLAKKSGTLPSDAEIVESRERAAPYDADIVIWDNRFWEQDDPHDPTQFLDRARLEKAIGGLYRGSFKVYALDAKESREAEQKLLAGENPFPHTKFLFIHNGDIPWNKKVFGELNRLRGVSIGITGAPSNDSLQHFIDQWENPVIGYSGEMDRGGFSQQFLLLIANELRINPLPTDWTREDLLTRFQHAFEHMMRLTEIFISTLQKYERMAGNS